MGRNKNNYFDLLCMQVEQCLKASALLEEILHNYSEEKLNAMRDDMHSIERAADEIQHDILNRLSAEFITPIDQEDILRLVQIIDDVTDAIDEVVLECYVYNLETLPSEASGLAKKVSACVNALSKAVSELKGFKKPAKLRALLVEVNSLEGEADKEYIEAVHNLFAISTNTKKLIGHKAIFESLENCCDLCEHAADVIEHIIIKNT